MELSKVGVTGAVLSFGHCLTQRWRINHKLRVEYEGAIYQVMNRGDRRELIFPEAEDRQPLKRECRCRMGRWDRSAAFRPLQYSPRRWFANGQNFAECEAA